MYVYVRVFVQMYIFHRIEKWHMLTTPPIKFMLIHVHLYIYMCVYMLRRFKGWHEAFNTADYTPSTKDTLTHAYIYTYIYYTIQ